MTLNAAEAQQGWFYVKGGERHGPITFAALKSLYESGSLSENTLVWTASFGNDWEQIDKIAGIRSPSEPPLLPVSEIPNHWLYLLISLPVIMAFIEAILFESSPSLFHADGAAYISFLLYFIPNTIAAVFDQNAVEKSGRKDAVQGLLVWIILLVPVYIFLRSKRTGKGVWPIFAWVAALVSSIFVTEALPNSVHLGSGVPQCDSTATLSMVEQIYPDIPINFISAQVIYVEDIEEVSFSTPSGRRECRAVVRNSAGLATPINYSITERANDFYYEVRFDGFQ